MRSHVILHQWIAFYSTFLNIHWSGVLTMLAWLVLHETAAISAHSMYTIQPCTMSLHAKHIHKVHVYLAVTCHLHFWQYDRGLLHATAVTQGWTDTEIRVCTESYHAEENSCGSCDCGPVCCSLILVGWTVLLITVSIIPWGLCHMSTCQFPM